MEPSGRLPRSLGLIILIFGLETLILIPDLCHWPHNIDPCLKTLSFGLGFLAFALKAKAVALANRDTWDGKLCRWDILGRSEPITHSVAGTTITHHPYDTDVAKEC